MAHEASLGSGLVASLPQANPLQEDKAVRVAATPFPVLAVRAEKANKRANE